MGKYFCENLLKLPCDILKWECQINTRDMEQIHYHWIFNFFHLEYSVFIKAVNYWSLCYLNVEEFNPVQSVDSSEQERTAVKEPVERTRLLYKKIQPTNFMLNNSSEIWQNQKEGTLIKFDLRKKKSYFHYCIIMENKKNRREKSV